MHAGRQTSGRWAPSFHFSIRKRPSSVDPRVAFWMLYKKTTPYDFTSVWSVTAPSAFRLLFNWATEWKGRKRGSWVLTDTRAHLHLQWIIKSSGRHFVDVFLIFPPKCHVCLFSWTSSSTTAKTFVIRLTFRRSQRLGCRLATDGIRTATKQNALL